jgi:RNA polymerase sigma factor (sigma-70 family)
MIRHSSSLPLLSPPDHPVESASHYKILSDAELVQTCLQGDRMAWEALILRYSRMIYSIASEHRLPDWARADIFQTVCVKLLQGLTSLKDEKKVYSWLITTTTRECRAVAAQLQQDSQTGQTEEPPDPAGTAEEIALAAERRRELRDMVEKLPKRCNALIRMLYFDGDQPGYEEIAECLGLAVGSIGAQRTRCLDRLRSMLYKFDTTGS